MSLKLNERYPGRFDNPTADYPQGSFKNRTTPDTKDGSYLEKDWANDKEGFFQSLLSAAGITANGSVDKVGNSQFYNALLQAFQSQAGAAFPATGTAPAFTLTPIPPIAAYATNQRFQVSFGAAGGATPTLNVSGKGAKNLKQYNSAGAKVAAVIASGQTSDVFYDGADLVLLDPLPADISPAQFIKLGQTLSWGENPLFSSGNSPAINTITGSTGAPTVYNQVNSAASAVIAFERRGFYGSYFGLDTDNQWKVGGWSMGANAYVLWHAGNFNPATKLNGTNCASAGFTDSTATTPFMTHANGTTVALSKKNTAQLAASGWSKNTDTGEIIQWVEVLIGDFAGSVQKTVTWPFQFPGGFLNAKINFRDIASNVNIQGAYGAASVTGCTIRVDEWSATIQSASLTAIVEARGF